MLKQRELNTNSRCDHLHPSLQVQHVLFMVSGVFYYFNSILNPILYTILSKRFRRGFSDISGKCWVYQVWVQILIWIKGLPKILQKFAKAVSRRSKEESSLDQELAEFNLVISNMSLLDNFLYWIFLYWNLTRWSTSRGGRRTARGARSSTSCPRSAGRKS